MWCTRGAQGFAWQFTLLDEEAPCGETVGSHRRPQSAADTGRQLHRTHAPPPEKEVQSRRDGQRQLGTRTQSDVGRNGPHNVQFTGQALPVPRGPPLGKIAGTLAHRTPHPQLVTRPDLDLAAGSSQHDAGAAELATVGVTKRQQAKVESAGGGYTNDRGIHGIIPICRTKPR